MATTCNLAQVPLQVCTLVVCWHRAEDECRRCPCPSTAGCAHCCSVMQFSCPDAIVAASSSVADLLEAIPKRVSSTIDSSMFYHSVRMERQCVTMSSVNL